MWRAERVQSREAQGGTGKGRGELSGGYSAANRSCSVISQEEDGTRCYAFQKLE